MHRRIRKLTLTCAHEADAQHGQVLLEDAMRTASLGDEGRLVIVRRLDLGHLSPRATATHWSRRVEQSYRQAQPVSVREGRRSIAAEAAVSFATRYEPWLIIAERTAARQASPEWFWRTAAPGWHSSLTENEVLQLCFRALAEQGGLRLTILLAVRLHARGALARLLQCLQPPQLESLANELPRSTPPPPPARPNFRLPRLTLTEIACVKAWGPEDVRTHWLAALHLTLLNNPVSAALNVALSPASTEIRQLVQQWTDEISAPTTTRSQPTSKSPAGDIADSPSETAVVPPHSTDRLFTQNGGLFFIVPLLVRIGFTEYLTQFAPNEQTAISWRLLQLVQRHVRTPDDDPIARMLTSLSTNEHRLSRWVLIAHRRSRRECGLTLRQLINRPALVSWSATHIDVFFRPTDPDIRVRRPGLDVDPGWVPWLGRAVAYHFNRED